jgi:hypothetical protein
MTRYWCHEQFGLAFSIGAMEHDAAGGYQFASQCARLGSLALSSDSPTRRFSYSWHNTLLSCQRRDWLVMVGPEIE